jgi:hypothetical protein
MAEVNKYVSQRFYQDVEYQDYFWEGVAGAGNYTSVIAVPDPFGGVVDLCQVTQVWFSTGSSGLPVIHFTVRKIRNEGGAMVFFFTFLYIK